jgi:hypothetical protein
VYPSPPLQSSTIIGGVSFFNLGLSLIFTTLLASGFFLTLKYNFLAGSGLPKASSRFSCCAVFFSEKAWKNSFTPLKLGLTAFCCAVFCAALTSAALASCCLRLASSCGLMLNPSSSACATILSIVSGVALISCLSNALSFSCVVFLNSASFSTASRVSDRVLTISLYWSTNLSFKSSTSKSALKSANCSSVNLVISMFLP